MSGDYDDLIDTPIVLDLLDYSTDAAITGRLIDNMHTGTLGPYHMDSAAAATPNNLFPPFRQYLKYSAHTYARPGNPISNIVTTRIQTVPSSFTATRLTSSVLAPRGGAAVSAVVKPSRIAVSKAIYPRDRQGCR